MQHVLAIPQINFSVDSSRHPMYLDRDTIEAFAKVKLEAENIVRAIDYTDSQIESFLNSYEYFLMDYRVISSSFGLEMLMRTIRVLFSSKAKIKDEEKTFVLIMLDKIYTLIKNCDDSSQISENLYEGILYLSAEFEIINIEFPLATLIKALEIRKLLLIKLEK